MRQMIIVPTTKTVLTPRNYDYYREVKMNKELTKLLFGEAGVYVSKRGVEIINASILDGIYHRKVGLNSLHVYNSS